MQGDAGSPSMHLANSLVKQHTGDCAHQADMPKSIFPSFLPFQARQSQSTEFPLRSSRPNGGRAIDLGKSRV